MFLIDSAKNVAPPKLELIAEKIVLPAHRPEISRSRLLNILAGSVTSCTSTILSGRAGTGKTSLALEFARTCGRPIAWYKVDAPEADLAIFFAYLVASIRQSRPRFGMKTLLPLVKIADEDHVRLLTEAFIYELEEDTNPLLIVIDDLHLVYDSPWLVPFFRRVLPLLPSHVHMLITSRTMPPAPLWRMRSKQTLLVINEETLAFSRPEAIALFESYGLSNDYASIALDHTHGRAAALAGFAAALKTKRNSVDLTADTRPLNRH